MLTRIFKQGVMVNSPCYTDNQNMQKGSFVLTLNVYDEYEEKFINSIVNNTNSSNLICREIKDYCTIPFTVIIPPCKKTEILKELNNRGYCEETLLPENDKIKKYAHILEEVKKGTEVL